MPILTLNDSRNNESLSKRIYLVLLCSKLGIFVSQADYDLEFREFEVRVGTLIRAKKGNVSLVEGSISNASD